MKKLLLMILIGLIGFAEASKTHALRDSKWTYDPKIRDCAKGQTNFLNKIYEGVEKGRIDYVGGLEVAIFYNQPQPKNEDVHVLFLEYHSGQKGFAAVTENIGSCRWAYDKIINGTIMNSFK